MFGSRWCTSKYGSPFLFFEGERTKLAPSIMHFAKQDANTRRDNLVPLGDVREYRRTQSGC